MEQNIPNNFPYDDESANGKEAAPPPSHKRMIIYAIPFLVLAVSLGIFLRIPIEQKIADIRSLASGGSQTGVNLTCGGIRGTLCPSGYVCDYGGRQRTPDASGVCVQSVVKLRPTPIKFPYCNIRSTPIVECPEGYTCRNTCNPAPGLVGCAQYDVCELLPTSTPTPIPSTPTSTATPIPPTSAPIAPGYCDASCQSDSHCVSGFVCREVSSYIRRCRNINCINSASCICPTPSPTPIVQVVTPTPRQLVIVITPIPTLFPLETSTPTPPLSEMPTPTATSSSSIPFLALAAPMVWEKSSRGMQIVGVGDPFSEITGIIQPDDIPLSGNADADGKFILSIPQQLSVGEKTVSLTADVLGNKQESTVFFRVEKEKTTSPLILIAVAVGVAGGIALGISFLKKKQLQQ